ncbi:MAG: TetR/AcrR family transcriptional regulator [Clostridiales bacterium]
MPLKVYEKEKILDICFNTFVEQGYSKTSTAILADTAGISKSLLFYHFKSKKKLYLSILERCFDKMAIEISNEPYLEFDNFFDAKKNTGKYKVAYLRNNPKVSKLLFEAFHSTPDELKEDIKMFEEHMEIKYKDYNNTMNEQIKKLFSEIPFRDEVNPIEAFELINAISGYFRMKLAKDLTDDSKLNDDEYWDSFFKKKNSFLDIIRHGIENKEV